MISFNNTYSVAYSGMKAAETQVAVSASNIVNMRSSAAAPSAADPAYRGYVPLDVQNSSVPGGGVQANVSPVDPAYYAMAGEAYPNTDLASDIVNMTLAENTYKANIKVINTASDMLDELLKI